MVDFTDETISPTKDVNGLKLFDFSARGPVLEMIFPAQERVDSDDVELGWWPNASTGLGREGAIPVKNTNTTEELKNPTIR
jgi:hypothetical protein